MIVDNDYISRFIKIFHFSVIRKLKHLTRMICAYTLFEMKSV